MRCPKAELHELLNPHTYIGLAPQIVDTIVATYGVRAVASENGSGGSGGRLTYAQAGVDIDEGDSLVERIKPLAAATRRAGAVGSIGGFGGLFDLSALPRPYKKPTAGRMHRRGGHQAGSCQAGPAVTPPLASTLWR